MADEEVAPAAEAPEAAPEAEAPEAEAAPEAPAEPEIPEEYREALAFRESLKTEEGVVDGFVELGVALGLTPDQLASLFPEEVVAEAEELAEELDRPLTRREIEALLQEQVLKPIAEQRAQETTAQQMEAVRGTITTTLDTLKVPEESRHMLLQFADQHIAESDRFDTEKVKAAVEQGAKDFDAWIEKQVQERVNAKSESNATIPTPIVGGTTGGGEQQGEPMSVAEAKARVRAQFGGR